MSQFIDNNIDSMNFISRVSEGLICVHAGGDVGSQIMCVVVAYRAWRVDNMPMIFASQWETRGMSVDSSMIDPLKSYLSNSNDISSRNPAPIDIIPSFNPSVTYMTGKDG